MKISARLLLCFCLTMLIPLTSFAYCNKYAPASLYSSQLTAVKGKPTILLIVKNLDNNTIQPYMFHISCARPFAMFNFHAHQYKILEARLQTNFGTIKRFCRIARGIVTDKNLQIRLRGTLDKSIYHMVCTSHYQYL